MTSRGRPTSARRRCENLRLNMCILESTQIGNQIERLERLHRYGLLGRYRRVRVGSAGRIDKFLREMESQFWNGRTASDEIQETDLPLPDAPTNRTFSPCTDLTIWKTGVYFPDR